ncbi:MAG: PH domain-containing protein [Gammaproteobacteria bacterium]|nr:PH domain-containing protein [Gammaproteobacteria bacterium]
MINKDFKYLADRSAERLAETADVQGAKDYRARPALRNQWFAILVAMLLFVLFVYFGVKGAAAGGGRNVQIVLALIGVPMLVLVAMIVYRYHVWTFTIRGDTIESCRGIIGRDVQSIRVQDLRNVNVRQTIWQRLLGVGDVEFSSAGGAGVEVTFYGVTDPLSVKNRVMRSSNR